MGTSNVGKIRGAFALARDAVEHGSRAIESIQKKTTDKPFAILEKIPGIEAPSKIVHQAIDGVVAITHVGIRTVNHAVGVAIDASLSAIDESSARTEGKTDADSSDRRG